MNTCFTRVCSRFGHVAVRPALYHNAMTKVPSVGDACHEPCTCTCTRHAAHIYVQVDKPGRLSWYWQTLAGLSDLVWVDTSLPWKATSEQLLVSLCRKWLADNDMTYLMLHLLPNNLMLLPALMQTSQLHLSFLRSSQQLKKQVNYYVWHLCLSCSLYCWKDFIQTSAGG